MKTKGRWGGDPRLYLEDCRHLIKRDYDDLHLFTGDEGSGKTTWAYQVFCALDPTFDETRTHFTTDDFLAGAKILPKGQAALWDEARLNKRRAMHGSTIRVLDFLQDCRGLNLHLGICFPHDDLLDDAVKNYRIRFRNHVVRRGLVQIFDRQKLVRGEVTTWRWRLLDQFEFAENTGPLWGRYLAKKDAHMRARNASDVEPSEILDAQGVDVAAIDEVVGAWWPPRA